MKTIIMFALPFGIVSGASALSETFEQLSDRSQNLLGQYNKCADDQCKIRLGNELIPLLSTTIDAAYQKLLDIMKTEPHRSETVRPLYANNYAARQSFIVIVSADYKNCLTRHSSNCLPEQTELLNEKIIALSGTIDEMNTEIQKSRE